MEEKVSSSEPVWVEEFYPGTGNPSYSSWAVMSAINIKRIHTTQLSTAMIRLWRKNDVTGPFGNILEDWDKKFILKKIDYWKILLLATIYPKSNTNLTF